MNFGALLKFPKGRAAQRSRNTMSTGPDFGGSANYCLPAVPFMYVLVYNWWPGSDLYCYGGAFERISGGRETRHNL